MTHQERVNGELNVATAMERLSALRSGHVAGVGMQPFFDEILEIMMALAGAPMASLYVWAANGQNLVIKADTGLPELWLEWALEVPVREGIGAGAWGPAAALQQAMYAPDLHDPLWEGCRDLARLSGLEACWAAPLVTDGDTLVGVLVFFYAQPTVPNADQIGRVERAAGQAARLITSYRVGQSSLQEMNRGLLVSLEAHDLDTLAHSRRVATYALLLAERLGVDQTVKEQIAVGALLHDVGKLGLSEEILQKPGALTQEEYEHVKQHPVLGHRLLRTALADSAVALSIVHHHHEWFNGRGYPAGLRGEQIPDVVRVVSVADAFDAMTTVRPYRKAFTLGQAREEIRSQQGEQFCPAAAAALLSLDRQTLFAVQHGTLDRSAEAGPLVYGLS